MRRERIPALDGWRGIAILLVLAGHSQYARIGSDPLCLGSHGVVLFFVLSGFLITRNLLAEKNKTGSIKLAKFYRHRVRRLLPASWTYLGSAALLVVFWRSAEMSKIEYVSAVFCFRNYVHTTGLTGHFWSLSVEEQFYLCWPLLVRHLQRRTLIIGVLGACLALAAARTAGWVLLPHAGGYTFHTEHCADALLVGCLAALVEIPFTSYLTGLRLWPFVTILVLQLLRNPLPLFGECSVIAVMLLISSRTQTAVNWTPLRWTGLISYSLYLWQEPFLMDGTHAGSALALLARLFGLTCVAALSWYFLEPNVVTTSCRKKLSTSESVWNN